MTDVIGSELPFDPIEGRLSFGQRHDSGIVDDTIQTSAAVSFDDGLGGESNRRQIGEIHVFNVNAFHRSVVN
jgi:hypothetical protein